MGEVRIEQRGRVLLATIANPPHALMDPAIVEGLAGLAERADTDPGVGAVVLTGEHPDRFVAHYDVGLILVGSKDSPSVGPRAAKASLRAVGAASKVPGVAGALARSPAAGVLELERFHATFLAMNRADAVFVAALNGWTQGGGSELALACDFRLMAAGDYGIGQPEVLLGFPPGGGGTQRLARLLGPAKALSVVLDGGPLSPEEALEIGYVDEVVPKDELLDRALTFADRLGNRPKAAIGAAKRAVYEGGSLPLADGLRLERAEFLATGASDTAVELMQRYVDALERTGELPLYDEAARSRALEEGAFPES